MLILEPCVTYEFFLRLMSSLRHMRFGYSMVNHQQPGGSLAPRIVFAPRIRMALPAPGSPFALEIRKPDASPNYWLG